MQARGHLIAYKSRKLNETERKYTVQEKEMGDNKGKPTTLSPNSREWNLYLEIGAGALGVMLLRDCFRSY